MQADVVELFDAGAARRRPLVMATGVADLVVVAALACWAQGAVGTPAVTDHALSSALSCTAAVAPHVLHVADEQNSVAAGAARSAHAFYPARASPDYDENRKRRRCWAADSCFR